jgi:hypothetical protein
VRNTKRLLPALMLAALVATALPAARSAQGRATAPVAEDQAMPATPDTGIGVVAAIGCGLGIRLLQFAPTPGVIITVASVCALMFVDAWLS